MWKHTGDLHRLRLRRPTARCTTLGIYRAARAGEFAAVTPLLAELIDREPVAPRDVLAEQREG